ncbi:hypothetical protein [Actinoplanes sp. NPDC049118]|uniref:hypothetical protein n=1 Tax=Actinoplanes sp. NPDC049118 TaxID=3155769 RepID=UPI003404E079
MADAASEDLHRLTHIPVEPVITAPVVPEVTADDPGPLTKIDITIAGHTVVVEAHRSMEDVADLAYDLIRRTAVFARRLPIGFDTGHADTQLSDWSSPAEMAAAPSPDRGSAHL